MKRYFLLLAACFLFSFCANAQGIYQLYGMTEIGGAGNIGTIFKTDASGNNFQLKHSFTPSSLGYNDGGLPKADLVEYNGKFYGTTFQAGSNNVGVIFEWDPVTNIYTKKIDLSSEIGSNANGSLTQHDGKFYGLTLRGGANEVGVIFEWDPATNIYTKKIDLVAATGCSPYGNLTWNAGKFYGMTHDGGDNNVGVIFEWDPITNIYAKKIDFDASENGRNPYGSLTFNEGKFYGTTFFGGSSAGGPGTIFEWDPVTNIYSKKADFDYTNGSYPQGNITFSNGKGYGMTGDNSMAIFEWDPATNVCVKRGGYGMRTTGSLTAYAGKFYGMTYQEFGTDPRNPTHGSIFEWDPATGVTTKKIQLYEETGQVPYGSLTLSNGKLYGLTSLAGGVNGRGTIFEWDPQTNIYTKKITLQSGNSAPAVSILNGKDPAGKLAAFGSKYYGTAHSGGIADQGVIFEWDPLTNIYTKKIDFNGIDGGSPNGGLALYEGKFYGMTSRGGPDDRGVIFEWDPTTNIYTKKTDITDIGITPVAAGELVLNNGKFYGMSSSNRFHYSSGGTLYFTGSIFEWDPITNIYTAKFNFNDITGNYPLNSLTIYEGKFYGLTNFGGDNDLGVIFEWDPSTGIYTKKFDFNQTDGSKPIGSLTVKGDKLFGMTTQGGINDAGVIFEWTPSSNLYNKRVELSNYNYGSPSGNLTLSGDKFYGITSIGGLSGKGIIFEWNNITNEFIKKADFDSINGDASWIDNNSLSSLPAPVANGTEGTCTSYAPVTIDESNNNKWVPIMDDQGNAVAEINANGNSLGVVNTSMYINTGAVRENAGRKLYLDRNLTITPCTQPSSPVDIRLYIKASEFEALKNAVNSRNVPCGINTIEDMMIFKNKNCCLSAVEGGFNTVSTAYEKWGNDYVLTGNIESFGSFYFAKKEKKTSRNPKGGAYTTNPHHHTIEQNLSIDPLVNNIVLYPNPVINKVNLTITTSKAQKAAVRLIDNTGRLIRIIQWNLPVGSTTMAVDVSRLAKGMYIIEINGETISGYKRFIKQ